MIETITKVNQVANDFIWGVPAIVCIIGAGILLSVRTRFIQVRRFGAAMKNTIGKLFDKTQAKEGSIAHACADTDNAAHQGLFGIFEVFMDTIVVCTMTGLVVLLAAPTINYGEAAGAELTISGFTATYGGWVSILTAVAMCCFAFSTIIGWGLYGSRCVEFLAGAKLVRPFLVVYSFVSIIGATIDLGLLWGIADTFNGFMAIPNLIALLMLSGQVKKLAGEVDKEQ